MRSWLETSLVSLESEMFLSFYLYIFIPVILMKSCFKPNSTFKMITVFSIFNGLSFQHVLKLVYSYLVLILQWSQRGTSDEAFSSVESMPRFGVLLIDFCLNFLLYNLDLFIYLYWAHKPHSLRMSFSSAVLKEEKKCAELQSTQTESTEVGWGESGLVLEVCLS